MRKRILALFLALVMCLSLLPTAAFAEDITTGGDGTTITGSDTTGAPADGDTTGDTATGASNDDDTTGVPADDTATGGDSTGGDNTTTDTPDTTDTTDTTGEGEDGDDDGDDIPVVQSAPLLGAAPSYDAPPSGEVHCLCGAKDSSSCTKAGHECGSAYPFVDWTSTTSLPVEANEVLNQCSYRLTADVTITGTWQVSRDTYLCLNGHTVTLDGNGPVIRVNSGATLYLTDCKNTGKITHASGKKGTGVYVTAGNITNTLGHGRLEMYGGEITGNTGNAGAIEDWGGGVYMADNQRTDGTPENAEFTMYGGKITQNRADWGGGVAVGMGGSFTMYGGEISGNNATENGGGVYASGGSFTMNGGKVINNSAGRSYGSVCPYVSVLGGNAEITGNTVKGRKDNANLSGYSAQFTVKKGFSGKIGFTVSVGDWISHQDWVVAVCEDETAATGTFIYDNEEFTVNPDLTLTCNHVCDVNGDKCSRCGKSAEVEATFSNGVRKCSLTFEQAIPEVGNGGSIRLLKDITKSPAASATSFIMDPGADNAITLDLNGKACSIMNGTAHAPITVANGTLILNDSSSAGTGTIHSLIVPSGAALEVKKGEITSSLTVESGGTATLSGGTFGKITVKNGQLLDLLADGYAFYRDNTIQSGKNVTELTNVSVKEHTCSAATGNACVCGRTIPFIAPAARTLTYTTTAAGGVAQQLVTAATYLEPGCTAMYRLKTGDTTWSEWSSAVPAAADAGTHTVQWYIAGSTNTERDGTLEAPKSLEVIIAPMKVTLELPAPNTESYALFRVEFAGDKNFVYTGQPIKPPFRLKDVNGAVIPESEYTYMYDNNTGVSKEAKIIINDVSGGNYTVGKSEDETYFFEIAHKPLTLEPETCTVEVAKGTGTTVDLALAAKSMGMRSDDGNLTFTFSADGKNYTDCETKYTWNDLQANTIGYFIVRSDNYQASFRVEITVTDTLSVSATVSSDSICAGESVTLKAQNNKVSSASSNITYQWYTVDLYGSERKIEGANAATGVYHIVLNDLGVHRFVCKATMNGQTVTSNEVSVTVKGRTWSNWGGEASYDIPTAKRVYYNGEYQELVTVAKGQGIPWYRLDGVGDWQKSIPTAKEPGIYYVSWYIQGFSLSGYPSIGSGAAPAGTIQVLIEETEAEVTFVDGTQKYYPTVNNAFDALKPQSTLKLMVDATYHDTDAGVGTNTDISVPSTLDLNGMTLSVTERAQGKYLPGTLRIRDTVTITSTAVAESPEETTEPVAPISDPVGKVANTVAVANGGKAIVKGDNVELSYLKVGSGGAAKLYGGTYGMITVLEGESCLALLPDGYAYFNKNGDPVDGDKWKLTEVSVKPHTCTLTSSGACACGQKCLHSSINSTTGICTICGLQMVARIGSGDTARYFPTLEAAAAATTWDNWVVTLLTDVVGATLDSTFLRVDMNGHALSGAVSVGKEASPTLSSIKGGGLPYTDLTVKNTFFTWVGQDDAVGNTVREIKSLKLENSNAILQLGENVTIGTLHVSAEGGYALNKMLPEGYVLKYNESENGTVKKIAKMTDTILAGTRWYNATIEKCVHTSSIDTSGKCNACGMQYGVEMTVSSTEAKYYSTLSEAADAVNAMQDTVQVSIKLLTDVKEQTGGVNKVIALEKGNVTLDLNGKTLTADITAFASAASGTDDRKLIMDGGGTLKGTLTVKGGTAELSGGTFNAITVTTGAGVGDLLKTGCGYQKVSGWVTGDDLKAATVSNVSINSVSTVSVTPVTSTITSGYSSTLTAAVTGADGYEVSYQWYEIGADGNEESLSGAEGETYTTATNLSVGTHTFVCKATANSYTATSNAVTVTVQGALTPQGGEAGSGGTTGSLTYTAPSVKDLTYNGAEQALVTAGTIGTETETDTGCKVMYRLGNDAETPFDITVPTATNAGMYTVQWYIDGGKSYNNVGSASEPNELTVTIASKRVALEAHTVHAVKEKQVSVDLKTAVSGQISDAEALTFELASDAPAGMSIGVDGCTLTFTPDDTGTYTATVNVTWKNHRGSFALSIASSEKVSLTVVNVGNYEKTYDGEAVDINAVTVNAKMLANGEVENINGAWSWAGEDVDAPVNVVDNERYSLTFTPADDMYDPVTVEAQITIKPKDIGGDGITATATGNTYTGSPITPQITVAYGETLLTNGTDYDVPDNISATNEGTHTLTINGTGNYTGTRRVQWIIAPAPLTINSLTAHKPYDSTAVVNGNTELDLVLDGIIRGESLVSGTDYTITAQFDSAAVGTRNVTARVKLLNGNYCFMEGGVPVREVQYSGTGAITRCPLATLPTVKADPVRSQQDVSLGTGSYLAADNVALTLPEGIDPSGELHFALGTLPAKVTAEIDEITGMLTYVIRGGRSGEKLTIPVTVTLPNFVAAADVPATQGVEDTEQETTPDTEQPIVLTFAVEVELTSRPHEHIRRPPTGGSSSNGTTSGGGIGSGGDISGNGNGSGTASGSDSTANSGVAGAGSGTGSGSGAMSPGTGDAGVAMYAMLSLSAAIGMCAIGCVIFSRRRRRG